MKYLRQMAIILGFSFVAELLHMWIPLPIPASVYGMFLLFVALSTGLVKLNQVSETGHFLVEIMAVMFICPAVGLLGCWDVIREALPAILVITVVSLLAVFGVAGRLTQWLLKRKERKEHV